MSVSEESAGFAMLEVGRACEGGNGSHVEVVRCVCAIEWVTAAGQKRPLEPGDGERREGVGKEVGTQVGSDNRGRVDPAL